MGTLHPTKFTTITMKVGADASYTDVTSHITAPMTENEQRGEPIISEDIAGNSEAIDQKPTAYKLNATVRVKRNNNIWYRAAYGQPDVSGTTEDIFYGTGNGQPTSFVFQNLASGSGTADRLKLEYTDSKVTINNISYPEKDVLKLAVTIDVGNVGRKLKYKRTT